MNGKRVSSASFVFIVIFCIHFSSIQALGWNKVSTHVETFLFSCSFVDGNNGWVAGFDLSDPFLSGNGGPRIFSTTTAAVNWTQNLHTNAEEAYVFMGIQMVDKQNGVVAGIGLPPATGIAITSDGNNWTLPIIPGEYFEESYLDVGGLKTSDGYFYYSVGQWSKYKEVLGEGLQISSYSNSSYTFTPKPWSLPSVYGARYASFVSQTQGWITAGNIAPVFPNPTPSRILITDRVYIDLFEKKLKMEGEGRQTIFEGLIVQTTDAGTTYQVLLNSTDLGLNIYFNGIDFVDSTHGWAVAVGTNSDNHTASYIFATTDGGSTWTQQLEADKVHLFRVRMYDDKNGWAVGFKFPDITLFSAALYHTTDGGKVWRDESIHDVIAFDVSVVNSTLAYAVGFGLDLSSNIYSYDSRVQLR